MVPVVILDRRFTASLPLIKWDLEAKGFLRRIEAPWQAILDHRGCLTDRQFKKSPNRLRELRDGPSCFPGDRARIHQKGKVPATCLLCEKAAPTRWHYVAEGCDMGVDSARLFVEAGLKAKKILGTDEPPLFTTSKRNQFLLAHGVVDVRLLKGMARWAPSSPN